ncbi:DUF2806 domain-containing protein [Fibrella aestuarina]|uniref:DUF2806 domain-containing protein n=1 Tax=Fibrella aestuarina TaxID=651143 RepID=UPI0006852A1C|nr:DUF2806 domain-containing protein [Fibrella aestuarina]
MDIKLVPFDKFIEVVSNGIGTLYKPRAIRNEADAEAYKMEVLANAEARRKLILAGADDEIAKRAAQRLVQQEVKRQQNIEAVAEKAYAYLPEAVSEEPVSPDWRTRFFNHVQDVSEKDMQDLWARILATEIAKPKSASIRLLDVLSTMSREEAIVFERMCALATQHRFVYQMNNRDLSRFGINYSDIMLLGELKLVHSSETTVQFDQRSDTIGPNGTFEGVLIPLGNKACTITRTNGSSLQAIQFINHAFTKAGEELCAIINVELNQAYLDAWVEERASKGYLVTTLFDLSVLG